jgi:hypothetical protein
MFWLSVSTLRESNEAAPQLRLIAGLDSVSARVVKPSILRDPKQGEPRRKHKNFSVFT